ncbi:CCL5 protein, partial [Alaudala cheleensis]|nr:CCL5 protein [Alaudala cheleensis]
IQCCFSYISRPIPRRMIQSAYKTTSSCPMQAVILVTRRGRKVCADPEAHWVQKHLEHLEPLDY